MWRSVTTILVLAAFAGCIEAPAAEDDIEPAAAAPDDRIEGMTIEESYTDSATDCGDSGGSIPPGFCAQRELVAEGRIGLDALKVELGGTNGQIRVIPSEGDAWRFEATVKVRALTEELAMRSLQTAWTWEHERDGEHAIVAKPNPTPSLTTLGARVISTEYTLELPQFVLVALRATTNNGAVHVGELAMSDVDVETDNGEVVLGGSVHSVKGRSDNGQIIATIRPTESGKIDLATDNGQVILNVPEGYRYGYDITGKTDNGQVIIHLRDGNVRTTENGATFTTKGYEERAIRVEVHLETDNGQAIVSPT